MTQEHPITPPPELVQQWLEDGPEDGEFGISKHIATQAANWGSDQELEACCHEVQKLYGVGRWLRSTRRPKPPSLKEQALETFRSMQIEPVVINGVNVNADVMGKYNIIRRALESLPD